MFIRKKKINGQEYAYLVRNKWIKDKGSRQKAKYMGKILHFDISINIDFKKHIKEKFDVSINNFILHHSKTDIINEIVIWELKRRGFRLGEVEVIKEIKEYGQTRRTVKQIKKIVALTKDKFYYKNRRLLKQSNHKESIIEMNEGFLCAFALNKVINAKLVGYDEREKAIGFAKTMLESGIKVDGDLFVLLFNKWNK